jgi:hypothetical protein
MSLSFHSVADRESVVVNKISYISYYFGPREATQTQVVWRLALATPMSSSEASAKNSVFVGKDIYLYRDISKYYRSVSIANTTQHELVLYIIATISRWYSLRHSAT